MRFLTKFTDSQPEAEVEVLPDVPIPPFTLILEDTAKEDSDTDSTVSPPPLLVVIPEKEDTAAQPSLFIDTGNQQTLQSPESRRRIKRKYLTAPLANLHALVHAHLYSRSHISEFKVLISCTTQQQLDVTAALLRTVGALHELEEDEFICESKGIFFTNEPVHPSVDEVDLFIQFGFPVDLDECTYIFAFLFLS